MIESPMFTVAFETGHLTLIPLLILFHPLCKCLLHPLVDGVSFAFIIVIALAFETREMIVTTCSRIFMGSFLPIRFWVLVTIR